MHEKTCHQRSFANRIIVINNTTQVIQNVSCSIHYIDYWVLIILLWRRVSDWSDACLSCPSTCRCPCCGTNWTSRRTGRFRPFAPPSTGTSSMTSEREVCFNRVRTKNHCTVLILYLVSTELYILIYPNFYNSNISLVITTKFSPILKILNIWQLFFVYLYGIHY